MSCRPRDSCAHSRMLLIAAWLAFTFARSTVLASSAVKLTMIAVLRAAGGFLIAVSAVYGGLIALKQPDFGRRLLSIVLCASALVPRVADAGDATRACGLRALRDLDSFACATISNDKLQDLKTGHLSAPHDASADRAQ